MNRILTVAFLAFTLIALSLCCPFSNFPAAQETASEINPSTNTPDTAPTVSVQPTEMQNPLPETPEDAATSIPPTPTATEETQATRSQTYSVQNIVELINDGQGVASHITLWLALVQTIEPYQVVEAFTASPNTLQYVTDEHGNLFALIEFDHVPAGETRTIVMDYLVTVYQIRYDTDACNGEQISVYTSPEMYIESNDPSIVSLANSITQSAQNDCQKARAIYDYVGDQMRYSQYTLTDMGALYALDGLQGDCTEFSDLFIALNRAVSIPANFVEGVTCCTESGYEPGINKHDWSEVYLPGIGWAPVDATWGRFPNRRNQYFAAITPDHIIVTRGRYLETLDGYHYYYYQYWWDYVVTHISSTESWSILPYNP